MQIGCNGKAIHHDAMRSSTAEPALTDTCVRAFIELRCRAARVWS